MEFKVYLDDGLLKRFEMALQLNEENREEVITNMLKSYVAKTFSQEAATYGGASPSTIASNNTDNHGKALHRIPKWAKKPSQINHKIIRAYLQLAENGTVTYDMMARYCNNASEHPDVYVPTFNSNFAQMKFDGEKSHGKVFDVDAEGVVTIWHYVENRIEEYKNHFILHTTDIGYTNDWQQTNKGCAGRKGSDHMQYLYSMHCNLCGFEYEANGTDIFQKKCPKCQGGINTGHKI